MNLTLQVEVYSPLITRMIKLPIWRDDCCLFAFAVMTWKSFCNELLPEHLHKYRLKRFVDETMLILLFQIGSYKVIHLPNFAYFALNSINIHTYVNTCYRICLPGQSNDL